MTASHSPVAAAGSPVAAVPSQAAAVELEPGKARRLPRSARRAQLLSAAQEVFVAQGYHSAAMDEIAVRAGVSKPVLYQHFPGKLELYLALIDHHTQALVDRIDRALAATTDNRQRVRGAISAYLDFVSDDDEAHRLVFETDLRNEPLVRERVDSVLERASAAIARTIAADTGLPAEESQLLSVGLIGLAEVSARWWLSEGGPGGKVSHDRAVDLLYGLAWRGIAGYPGPRQSG